MKLDSQSPIVNPEQFVPCSLMRRTAAMIYDFILLMCILFIAWLPMPLVTEYLNPFIDRAIRLLYLLAVCFLYFAWPWCRGGQTLGMRSWNILLISSIKPEYAITPKQALLRFTGSVLSWAALGAGFLISGFHPQKLAWHDLMSDTRIVRLSGGLRTPRLHNPQHKDC